MPSFQIRMRSHIHEFNQSTFITILWTLRDWCLVYWQILPTSVVRTWGQISLGQFLVSELNIQYPVKSIAPYLVGHRRWVPSDSLRKFLQEVNLYYSFNIFLPFFKHSLDGGYNSLHLFQTNVAGWLQSNWQLSSTNHGWNVTVTQIYFWWRLFNW